MIAAQSLQRMSRRMFNRPRLDWPLVGLIMATVALGMVILYSASEGDSQLVIKQGVRFLIGLAVMFVISHLPPTQMRHLTPFLYVVGIVLLLIVAFAGVGTGAQRWLNLGVARFQPSELLKLSVPMMMAWYLHSRSYPPSLRTTLSSLVIVVIPAVLIYQQPDLGTAILVAISGLFVLFLSGLSWRLIISLAVAAAALSPILWNAMHEYQKNRVLMFLDPEADPLGRGWNIIQSKIAVGSGGLTGKGWQQGTQAHLEFLPEKSTDFILATFAEEFGLMGVLVLFSLYMLIIWRGLVIAMAAKDCYSRLLSGALVLTFFVYVAVNAGMVSGLLPVVGVPLPLVSYGGTSMVSLMAGFGVIMSIYAHRKFISSDR